MRRSQVYVIGTIVALTILGAFYLLIVVPNNERILLERRFRVLQNAVSNAQDKIKNSDSLLARMVLPVNAVKRNQFINTQNQKGSFVINTSGRLPLSESLVETDFALGIDSATRNISLSCKARFKPGKTSGTHSGYISIRFTAEQFLSNLLPDQIFDEYLVFTNATVLYESSRFQISPDLADSLLQRRPGLNTSSIPLVTLAGIKYRVFMQGFSLGGNTRFTIVGLLKQGRFQDQRMALPGGILMIMLTLIFLIMIGYPWIKLYQMGSRDRLTTTDTVATVVGMMLLMGLIFFISFNYCRVSFCGYQSSSLDNLSATLLSRFQTERDNYYKLLRYLDEAPAPRQSQSKGAVESITRLSTADFKSDLPAPVDSARIDQVFWLNDTGEEIRNWTTKADEPLNGNYRNRNYFKRGNNESGYHLNQQIDQPYFLDQIVSWTDGSFTSVMSIPARKHPGEKISSVTAMTCTFSSLSGSLLPSGFEFAFVDSAGKVLYHSKEAKNLNENLLSEFSEAAKLEALLRSRAPGNFSTKYLDENYRIKVSPVPDLPYSLVVMENTDFEDAVDVEVYSFTFVMFLLVVGFSVLLSLVSLLLSSRQSLFRKQSFDVIRFAPKKSLQGIYKACSVFNLFLVLLLWACFRNTYILEYLFLLPMAIVLISLFYNAVLFLQEFYSGSDRLSSRIKSLSWFSLILFLLLFTALRNLQGDHLYRVGVLLVAGLMGIATGLFWVKYYMHKKPEENAGQKNRFLEAFAVMLTTRMVITCGIPVVFFYLSSLLFQHALSVRDRSLLQAEKMYSARPGDPNIYPDSNYVAAFRVDTAGRNGLIDSPVQRSKEDLLVANLLNYFRLRLSHASRRAAGLSQTEDTANLFHFNALPLQLSDNKPEQLSFPNRNSGRAVLISAPISSHPARLGHQTVTSPVIYVIIFLLLVLFTLLVRQTIRKLFALNLPDLKKLNDLDKEIVVDDSINHLLFLIGLPGSGKLQYIKDLLKENKIQGRNAEPLQLPSEGVSGNVFIADLIRTPDSFDVAGDLAAWSAYRSSLFDPSIRLIVLNHFEYNMQVDVTSHLKLNLLEELMQNRQCKIIVLSTVHPVAFLDSINASRGMNKDQPLLTHDLERWHVLLGHYRMIILPIHVELPVMTDDNPGSAETGVSELIRQEIGATHFLHDMKAAVSRVAYSTAGRSTGQFQDELSFKLQITAHYFYMYIWQSLTKEEKYLLYDLAEDKLVNSYDTYNLSLLIAKGVIRNTDGLLTVFNRGFRNFILTAIGHAEASNIKNRLIDTGNWNNLRIPIILVLVAMLSFLFFSQQEAYSELIAYVAAISAGIPAVLKIFSLFEQKFHKEGS